MPWKENTGRLGEQDFPGILIHEQPTALDGCKENGHGGSEIKHVVKTCVRCVGEKKMRMDVHLQLW